MFTIIVAEQKVRMANVDYVSVWMMVTVICLQCKCGRAEECIGTY